MSDELLEKATKELAIARLAMLVLEATGGTAKNAAREAQKMAHRIIPGGAQVYVTDASGEGESSLEALAVEIIKAGGAPAAPKKPVETEYEIADRAMQRKTPASDANEAAEKMRAMQYGL